MSDTSELPPRRVAELLRDTDAQLVDVRTPEEHEAGRITGDEHIELSELPAEAARLDRRRPLVFYSRSGARSAMATSAQRPSLAAITGSMPFATAAGTAQVTCGVNLRPSFSSTRST